MTASFMVLNLLILLMSGMLCVPVFVLVLQVVTASFTRNRPCRSALLVPGHATPRFAVIMPAHNESQGIARAIQSVLPQCQPGDRLVVVADNCSDNTAAVALANVMDAAYCSIVIREDIQAAGRVPLIEQRLPRRQVDLSISKSTTS